MTTDATHPVERLRRVTLALVPVLIAASAILAARAVRVATPVQLDVLVSAVTMTIAGANPVALLNASTPFATLTVEQCRRVSFPAIALSLNGTSQTAPSPVSFSCDSRVPGSRVTVRHDRAGDPAARDLGTIGRILADPGDRVGLALASTRPHRMRLEVGRQVSFDFSLRKNLPFEIATEFAAADTHNADVEPGGVSIYRASLPAVDALRIGSVDSGSALNIVVEPAADESTGLFRTDLDIPIDGVSLFDRSDVDDSLVSTALSGTLTYSGRSDKSPLPIEIGESVRLRSASGLRLTQLRLERDASGFWLRLEGEAAELRTGGADRRLTWFDRVVTDRNRGLIAIIAVFASQLAWLRRVWAPPAHGSVVE